MTCEVIDADPKRTLYPPGTERHGPWSATGEYLP